MPGKRGQVQEGRRFAVIVQTDDLLALSTVVICPTSRAAFQASFHPEIIVADQAMRFRTTIPEWRSIRRRASMASPMPTSTTLWSTP
jgi:mRNA-degrading endonuclease toxin of MazEF toxin-antitoxin module